MRRMLAISIAIFALTGGTQAQEPKPRKIPFEGVEVFCHILFHEDLQPVTSVEDLNKDPEDTLLIELVSPLAMRRWFERRADSADSAPREGNVLVATDRRFQDNTMTVIVQGSRLRQPAETAYGDSECPWIPIASATDHPLFSSLRKGIATNRPSYVTFPRPPMPPVPLIPPGGPPPKFVLPKVRKRTPDGLEALLRFSDDVKRDDFQNFLPLSYMMGSPKDSPPKGRAMIIGGHGMFLNCMMLQSDNDNFEFAVNAIRWLREGPEGKTRTKAMFIVDGKIITDFNMNLSPPATAPPPPQIPVPPVEALNRLIRGMEEEEMFHKILRGVIGDNLERFIGLLLALLTFGLLLYGIKKFLERRHSHETSVPIMVGTVATPARALTRGQQRYLALNQQNDASRQASQLACAWMQAEFGVTPDALPAGSAITLQTSGFFLFRWGLQSKADGVLALARAPESLLVSRRQFAALVADLPGLSAAIASGRLALLVDGKNVRHERERS